MEHFKLKTYDSNTVIFSGQYNSFLECLEDAALSGLPLAGLDLKHQNLTNANLDGASLIRADFTGANLTGANLSEAYLQGGIFENTSLFNTCFCYSDLRSCDFRSASFGGTDITGANISHSTFSSLSCFDLDFWHTDNMDGCRYINPNGTISPMSQKPIIIKGLMNTPILILDHDVHIGAGNFPKQSLDKILALTTRNAQEVQKIM